MTRARWTTAGLVAVFVVLIAGAAASVAILWSRRTASAASDAATRTAQVDAGAVVRTIVAMRSDDVRHVELLGEARPMATVTLYAKVSGYLKTIAVDVGDHVKMGQVVATIESPETDRALLGAKADFDNRAATAARIAKLLDHKYVSPQEAEQAKTDAAVAEQRVASLSEQQAYETLKAPLTGTVTARFADPGALMQSAASSQTSALPVVTVAQTDSLRVLIYLDQADASLVHRGARATIGLTERPDIHIVGTVARVSGELDPKTRKMLVEVDVDNRVGEIIAGSFVQVRLDVPTTARIQAPAEALTVRQGHTLVGVVDPDATIHFREATVLSNDGQTVIFGSGVSAGDRLAINVGSAIADGARVQVDTSGRATAAAGRGTPK